MSLRLVPISLEQANEHVAAWHRHNDPVSQAIFKVGVADENGVLRAVAIAEWPKGRGNADGDTIEITRVASDGTPNACSMLYGGRASAPPSRSDSVVSSPTRRRPSRVRPPAQLATA